MTREQLRAEVQRLAAGLSGMSHNEREGLALDAASAISGEDCQFVRCHNNTLTAWFPKEAPAAIRAQEAGGRKARTSASGSYTPDELELIRKAGLDLAVLEGTKGARNYTEWKQMKAAGGPPDMEKVIAARRRSLLAGRSVNYTQWKAADRQARGEA